MKAPRTGEILQGEAGQWLVRAVSFDETDHSVFVVKLVEGGRNDDTLAFGMSLDQDEFKSFCVTRGIRKAA